MSESLRTIDCPLAGFETVKVTYNVMASERQLEQTQESMGAKAEGVIIEVSGWPGGDLGPQPFGPEAPLGFRAWVVRNGFYQAITDYVSDPNFSTGSKRSTRPTRTGD